MSEKNELVAWYGAIVATLSLIMSFFVVVRDRGRIKIEISKKQHIIGDPAIDSNDIYVSVYVINRGRRPVVIEEVGFIQKSNFNNTCVILDSLKKGKVTLDEKNPKESYLIKVAPENLLNDIVYFYAKDSKHYYYYKYIKSYAFFSRIYRNIKHYSVKP